MSSSLDALYNNLHYYTNSWPFSANLRVVYSNCIGMSPKNFSIKYSYLAVLKRTKRIYQKIYNYILGYKLKNDKTLTTATQRNIHQGC